MRRVKPRVLLDCDGVLADFIGAWIDLVADAIGVRLTHDEVDDWHFFSVLEKRGIDYKHLKDLEGLKDHVWSKTKEKGFCQQLRIFEGAQKAVAALQEVSELYIVTSPNDSEFWMYERTHWLMEHFNVPYRRIGYLYDKFLVEGDYLIDDRVDNVFNWTAHQNGLGILFANSGNNLPQFDNPQKLSGRVFRTNDWDEILETVRAFPSRRVGP